MFTRPNIFNLHNGDILIKRTKRAHKYSPELQKKYILMVDRVTHNSKCGTYCERTYQLQNNKEVYCIAYEWIPSCMADVIRNRYKTPQIQLLNKEELERKKEYWKLVNQELKKQAEREK